jgi:DNA-binding XRE family transcriptional regulator
MKNISKEKGGQMDNNISQVIRAKNINQADLARKVGINQEYLNDIINRKITPTVPLGKRIAEVLEVPLEELFFIRNLHKSANESFLLGMQML